MTRTQVQHKEYNFFQGRENLSATIEAAAWEFVSLWISKVSLPVKRECIISIRGSIKYKQTPVFFYDCHYY